MDLLKKFSTTSVVLLFSAMNVGCASLDIQPWTAEEIVDDIIISSITGVQTSYGNQARCNHYKMIGGSSYREWYKNGKIACSYQK